MGNENVAGAPGTSAVVRWETTYGLVEISRDIVRAYFCPKATDGEIEHFMAVCRYHQLNPWLKEAYLVKYTEAEAAKIVFGKDSHARKAEEHPQYAGDESGILVLVKTADGAQLTEREGAFYLDTEILIGGWARVFRKDRERPVSIRVRLSEYVQYTLQGPPNRFWREKPATMIRKVALSQARHEAFPSKFAGGMSEEEAPTGPVGDVIVTTAVTKPRTNAEANMQAAADQVVDQVRTDPTSDGGTGPVEDEAALAAEARARELAEAGAFEPTPATTLASPAPAATVCPPSANGQTYQSKAGMVTKTAVFAAANDAAKRLGKSVGVLMKELTGKAAMSGMDDADIAGLIKKLGI